MDLLKDVASLITAGIFLMLLAGLVCYIFGKPRIAIAFPDDESEPVGCDDEPDANKWSSRIKVYSVNRKACRDCRVRIHRVDRMSPNGKLEERDILPGGVDLRWSLPGAPETVDISPKAPGLAELFSFEGDSLLVPSAKDDTQTRRLSCGMAYYSFRIEVTSRNAPPARKDVSVHCPYKDRHPVLYLHP